MRNNVFPISETHRCVLVSWRPRIVSINWTAESPFLSTSWSQSYFTFFLHRLPSSLLSIPPVFHCVLNTYLMQPFLENYWKRKSVFYGHIQAWKGYINSIAPVQYRLGMWDRATCLFGSEWIDGTALFHENKNFVPAYVESIHRTPNPTIPSKQFLFPQ